MLLDQLIGLSYCTTVESFFRWHCPVVHLYKKVCFYYPTKTQLYRYCIFCLFNTTTRFSCPCCTWWWLIWVDEMCSSVSPPLWRCGPIRARASSFLRFLDHTQRRTTVGRTPPDEWSARRRDLYLTAQNTHIPTVGFEPTVSAGERPQTYVLDRAVTGAGLTDITAFKYMHNA